MTHPRSHTRVPKRATRPAGPPTSRRPQPADPTVCCCRHHVDGQLVPGGRPMLTATFVDGELARVELRHWEGRDGCQLAPEYPNPAEWGYELLECRVA